MFVAKSVRVFVAKSVSVASNLSYNPVIGLLSDWLPTWVFVAKSVSVASSLSNPCSWLPTWVSAAKSVSVASDISKTMFLVAKFSVRCQASKWLPKL